MAAVLKDTPPTALVVIEKPMRAGKLEDAFAEWMRRARLNGIEIAMPTTVTSNQLHERVTALLQKQLCADLSRY